MKILVIQTAFIGDVILATSLLEQVHQLHPHASIDLLVRKGNEGLFAGHPFLRQVLVWNKKERKLPHLLHMIRTVRKERYDLVLNLHRFASSGLITVFAAAGETRGFRKNPWSFLFSKRYQHQVAFQPGDLYSHEVERNLQLLELPAGTPVSSPRLYPSAAAFEKVKQYQQQPYVCIAPASVWFTKQWPSDQWVQLIHALPAHLSVFLLGAPADDALCNNIAAACTHRPVQPLCKTLSLLESAALMQGARMNFVNDSAPLHLASAMNAPVTAIFCSTTARFGFGPLGDDATVVETTVPLACKPCGLHGKKKCPEGHFNCARTIQVEQVLSSLIRSR